MPHITFIHGISNKPKEEALLKIWLDSLSDDLHGNGDGINIGSMGITCSMIYWADVLYENPLAEGTFENAGGYESNDTIAENQNADPDMSWRNNLSGEQKQMVDALASRLSFDVLVNDDAVPNNVDLELAATLERIPLPWFIKRRLMKVLLKDVHHYLFDYDFSPRSGTNFKVQKEIRERVIRKLKAVNTDKHIVISHSMGTVIIYDCLKRVPDCPSIDALFTVGSPLGIDEVQDKFAPEWRRDDGFPAKVKGSWINVYDPFDPVTGFDGNIANDFKKNGTEFIEVIKEENWGAWRHNITNYFSQPLLRGALHSLLKT
jgi:hypothetical protein